MIEDEATSSDAIGITIDAIAAAARAVAGAFELGDEAVPSDHWPAGDEIAVLGATVLGGGLGGALLLAVDRGTAERITAEPDQVAHAFQGALAALTAVNGLPLELVEFGTPDLTPTGVVDIRAGGVTTARFGVVIARADAGAGEPSVAESIPSGDGPAATNFQPAVLAADGVLSTPSNGPLSMLHDVEMDVTVELGRTTMPIRDLLSLQPGMVVEIDRAASAPIDVLVNGRLIACGEVVVIDEEFGIRITEIVSNRAPT